MTLKRNNSFGIWRRIFIFAKTLNRMTNDILESISQGSCGEENSENNRIEEITNELRRRCKLYEENVELAKQMYVMLPQSNE